MAQVMVQRSTSNSFEPLETQSVNQTNNSQISSSISQSSSFVQPQSFDRSPLSQLYVIDPTHINNRSVSHGSTSRSMNEVSFQRPQQVGLQQPTQTSTQYSNPSCYQQVDQSMTQYPFSNQTIDLLAPPVTKRLRVDTRKANQPINASNYQASYQTYGMMHNKPNRLINYGSYSVPSTPQSNHLSVYQWPGAHQSINQSISPECSISPLTISVTPAHSPIQHHNSPVSITNPSNTHTACVVSQLNPIVEETLVLPPQPSDLSSNEPVEQFDSSVPQFGEGTLLVPPHVDAMASRMLDDRLNDGRLISGTPASAPPNQSLEPQTPEPHCRRVREDKEPTTSQLIEPLDVSPTGDSEFSNTVRESINRSSSQSAERTNTQSINQLGDLSIDQADENLDREFAPAPSLPEMLATVAMVLHVQLLKAVNDQSNNQSNNKPNRLANFVEECPHYFSAGHPVFGQQPSAEQVNNQLLTVRELYSYLLYVFQKGKFEPDFALIMLIYFHRTLAYNQSITLTINNWRPLLMSSLLLAQKMFDDSPLINTDFRYLYPYLIDRNKLKGNQTSGQAINHAANERMVFARKFNRLEMELCQLIDWNLTIDESTYLLYRRELAAIWKEYDSRQAKTTNSSNNQTTSQPMEVEQPKKQPQVVPQTTRAPHRKLEIPAVIPTNNPTYGFGASSSNQNSPHPWISPSSASSIGRKRKSSLSDFEPPHYFLRSNNQTNDQTINQPQPIGSGPLNARPMNQQIIKTRESGHRRRHSMAR